MLSIIKMYKTKIILGVLVALIVSGVGVMALQLRAETRAAASLREKVSSLVETNASNQAVIAELQTEIARREMAQRQRDESQVVIEQEFRAALQASDDKIEQMRAQYEEVNEFLGTPAPDAFVEHWMRERSPDRDPDGDDPD